jgi:glycosyltransferase involved in cell wall biosynthesis
VSALVVPRALDAEQPAPRVTVVIPCYNYGRFLDQAVGGALDQPGVDVDVIIVDDASPDGSREIAEQLAADDARVSVIPHSINRGHIATYNDGLAAASGEYVTLVSADDVLAPGALSRATALFRSFPDVGLVYGSVVRFSGPKPPPPAAEQVIWRVWPGLEWAQLAYSAGRNPLFSPEAVLRSDVQQCIGGYQTDEPHAGDFAMWLRAAAVAGVGFVGGADHAHYRDHGQNMHTETFATDQGEGLVTDLQARWDVLEKCAPGFEPGERMLNTARVAMAAEALDLASRAYLWGFTAGWRVEALEQFALEIYPQARTLREYRALRRRKFAGRRMAKRNPVFLPRERRLSRSFAADQRNRRRFGI